jgi:hypothetical protein
VTVIESSVPTHDGPAVPRVESSARVSFRQPIGTYGFIDAGWWPRSRDLVAELRPLLETLFTAGREVSRVSYNLGFFSPAPRVMQHEGRTVKLGGFKTQNPLVLSLADLGTVERIDLLVIPPETPPEVAERALLLAATSHGTARPAEILASAATNGATA